MAKKKQPSKVEDLGTADDLPLEHVPKGLRPVQPQQRTRVMYACGWEVVWKGDDPKVDYGMWAGVFPNVEQALDSEPPRDSITNIAKANTAVIVRFNLNGTDEVIYRWQVPKLAGAVGKWGRAK